MRKLENFMMFVLRDCRISTRMVEFWNNIFHCLIFHVPFVIVGQRLKRQELYFWLGKNISVILFPFGSFSSVHHLVLLWKLVSLIFLFLVHVDPSVEPYPRFSQAHSLMPLLFWQRNDWRGQAYHRELQPFPPSFIPYSYSLFGIQQVSSSNVAHFLPDAHTHAQMYTNTYLRPSLLIRLLPPSSLTLLMLLPRLLLFLFQSTPVKEYPFSIPLALLLQSLIFRFPLV